MFRGIGVIKLQGEDCSKGYRSSELMVVQEALICGHTAIEQHQRCKSDIPTFVLYRPRQSDHPTQRMVVQTTINKTLTKAVSSGRGSYGLANYRRQILCPNPKDSDCSIVTVRTPFKTSRLESRAVTLSIVLFVFASAVRQKGVQNHQINGYCVRQMLDQNFSNSLQELEQQSQEVSIGVWVF